MKFTAKMVARIDGQTIAVNTSDNRSFIGKVLEVDENNILLSVAGTVGNTVGILNKDRITYVECNVVTALTILEQ